MAVVGGKQVHQSRGAAGLGVYGHAALPGHRGAGKCAVLPAPE